MNLRLLILKLRNSQSWSTCKFLVVIGYVIFMVLTVAYLFKKTSSVSENDLENPGNFDTLKDLGDVPAEVLEFEAKVGNVFLYLLITYKNYKILCVLTKKIHQFKRDGERTNYEVKWQQLLSFVILSIFHKDLVFLQ